MNRPLPDGFEDFIVQRLESVQHRLDSDDCYQREHFEVADKIKQLADTLNPEQLKLLNLISYGYGTFFPALHQRAAYRLGFLDGLKLMATL